MFRLLGVILAIPAVVLAIFVGIYFNQTVPEGMASDAQHVKRVVSVLMSTARFIGKASRFLGFDTEYGATKKFLSLFVPSKVFHDKVVILDGLSVWDVRIGDIKVRLYRPAVDSPFLEQPIPALIYYHGGGWTFGSIETVEPLCKYIAKETGIVVASVEYRLAPEYHSPVQFDDCLSVTNALLSNGEDYGIDVNRVVVGGDSAGGNLAAAISHQLKDTKTKPIAQVLIYPAVQFLDMNLPSFLEHGIDDGVLSQEHMAQFWSLYLTGRANLSSLLVSGRHSMHLRNTKYFSYVKLQDKEVKEFQKSDVVVKKSSEGVPEKVFHALIDATISPLMADSFKELPPTLIIAAEFDCLKTEGLLYRLRLQEADIKVTYLTYTSFHAFVTLTYNTVDKIQAISDIVQYLRENLFHIE